MVVPSKSRAINPAFWMVVMPWQAGATVLQEMNLRTGT